MMSRTTTIQTILILGGILILTSYIGDITALGEEVTVPPNSHLEWSLNPNIGAKVHTTASLMTETDDSATELIELYIMDDGDYQNYVDENWSELSLPPAQRDYADERWPAMIEYRIPRMSEWHVVLNNKVRVADQEQSKPVNIEIHVTMPYTPLRLPGIALLLVGVGLASKRGIEGSRRGIQKKSQESTAGNKIF